MFKKGEKIEGSRGDILTNPQQPPKRLKDTRKPFFRPTARIDLYLLKQMIQLAQLQIGIYLASKELLKGTRGRAFRGHL